ncbi:MAG: hypothetical protein AAF846_12020 [Chloroflexota bacterium]
MVQSDLNCLHQHYLTNGIHKLVLQNNTEATVDDALTHLKKILDEHPAEEQLKLLIDARAGVPPLRYFFKHLRTLYGTYDELPPIRAVYIYHDSVVLSVLQLFFNALRMNASRRFIRGGTELEAQDWLLSDDDQTPFSSATV